MLIILYIITAALVLAGFQPLKIAGIFFGICYLPGLTLFALIKKEGLKIEDLILSFPASVGISSLLTLGLLYIGVHVKFIAYIIYGISGFIILSYVIKYKKSLSLTINLSGGEIRFIIIAFLMTLAFSIPVISERIAISAHGFHHFSMVTRIFNGFFPPENPGIGGAAIGYQWGYHALVAAISFPANFHPLRVFSVINIMSLFFIFCIAYRSAKSFGIPEGYCYLVPLALIGLMRSDAGIFYARNLLSGNFHPVQDAASAPLHLLTSWVGGVSYLDTRLFFMNKFYNANNMPVGICFVFAFFLILLLLEEEKIRSIQRKIYTALLAPVLIALAVTYAFFLIIPLLFIPVWAGVLFLTNNGSYRDKFGESFRLIAPCAIAAVITAPYLSLISSGNSVVTAGRSVGEFKFIYLNVQVIRNLIVFLLPSPLIIAGFWFAFKRFSFSRRFLFLLSGTLICLLLSVFLRLNWSNSAKFSFILSFFFAFLFVFSLIHIMPLFSNIWLKRAITVCLIVFLLATPVITEAAYICSPWFRDTTYAFSGRHVVFAQDNLRNGAYTWIRDNTPPDALLLLPYYATPFAPDGITIAQIFSYRPTALSERSLFVIKDVYAYLRPEYKERVRIREQFFKNPQNTEVKQYIASLNRPVYLLVEEGYDDPLMEGVEFNKVPEYPGAPFVLVYQNDMQRVYSLQFKK
ncbi:MAG TPA: hypothetical protein ENG83_11210 [Nitrospirae bacterium]|nr:hypothetical protein BMS3Abin06_01474 [bacterium BMS3Abin06]HDH12742.1 hypothetical protein [Nitrospirota bacterium]HDZ00051.1 hypothetical protein [Nitrospirota bacterium]